MVHINKIKFWSRFRNNLKFESNNYRFQIPFQTQHRLLLSLRLYIKSKLLRKRQPLSGEIIRINKIMMGTHISCVLPAIYRTWNMKQRFSPFPCLDSHFRCFLNWISVFITSMMVNIVDQRDTVFHANGVKILWRVYR